MIQRENYFHIIIIILIKYIFIMIHQGQNISSNYSGN
jgi:hypothetical protein